MHQNDCRADEEYNSVKNNKIKIIINIFTVYKINK